MDSRRTDHSLQEGALSNSNDHYPAGLWRSVCALSNIAYSLAQGWGFDSDLGETADPAWDEEIDQLIAHGGRFMDEVVFFHRSSRTLILADLIENFEPGKVHSPILRFLLKLAGNSDPDGKLPIDLRLSYWGKHDEIGQAVAKMLRWEPERIILAHGRWYQNNGVAELRRAFRWIK